MHEVYRIKSCMYVWLVKTRDVLYRCERSRCSWMSSCGINTADRGPGHAPAKGVLDLSFCHFCADQRRNVLKSS